MKKRSVEAERNMGRKGEKERDWGKRKKVRDGERC